MNTIYLVRHGENRANVTRELSHRHVDYDLTERGRLQARQLGAFFAGIPLDAVYASPLKRAQQTAAPIAAARGLPVQTLEHLREINVGDLEIGQTPENLPERWAADNAVVAQWLAGQRQVRYPNGENYPEAVARFAAGLAEALTGRDGQTVALVGHSGLYQCALAWLVPEVDLAQLRRVIPLGGYGRLSLHALDPLRAELHAWGLRDHQSGDALNDPERPAHLASTFHTAK